MFGLMRMRGCGLGHTEREARRLNYCGTCKVIGREYGQGSRLLLNHDTVLVAEIMTGLSGQCDWPAEIQSRNCFSLPVSAEAAPIAARYAAAATVLLASAKVRDHVSDGAGPWWRFLAAWLNPRYRRAATDLRRLGVPVDEIELQLRYQKQRERSPESLEQLAGPTCFATAEICAHAARVAGHPEAEASLRLFGHRFGYLIYLLDAWEDFSKDAASGQFNAFQALYGTRSPGRADLVFAADALETSFRELPLAEPFREGLIIRFRTNLTARMADPLPILQPRSIAAFAFAGMSFGAVGTFFKPKPVGEKVNASSCDGCGDSCGDCCCGSCCEGICDSISC
jgi:hypothetical protein